MGGGGQGSAPTSLSGHGGGGSCSHGGGRRPGWVGAATSPQAWREGGGARLLGPPLRFPFCPPSPSPHPAPLRRLSRFASPLHAPRSYWHPAHVVRAPAAGAGISAFGGACAGGVGAPGAALGRFPLAVLPGGCCGKFGPPSLAARPLATAALRDYPPGVAVGRRPVHGERSGSPLLCFLSAALPPSCGPPSTAPATRLSRLSRGGPLQSLSLRQAPPPSRSFPSVPRWRVIPRCLGLLWLRLRNELGPPKGPGALGVTCGSRRGGHPISLTLFRACAVCGTTTNTRWSSRFGAVYVAGGGRVGLVGPSFGGGPVTLGGVRCWSFAPGGECRVLVTDGRAVRTRRRRLAVSWRQRAAPVGGGGGVVVPDGTGRYPWWWCCVPGAPRLVAAGAALWLPIWTPACRRTTQRT